jgi:lysophospholipase L1-like esterase
MRPRSPLPLVLVVLVGLLAACRADEIRDAAVDVLDEVVELDEPPEVIRYVALGDSIAVGTGATTSYVAEYAAWLEAETGSTVTVTNRAANGWTTADILRAVRTDTTLREAMADAHLITLNAGGNDLLQALATVRTGRCGGDDDEACLRAAVDQLRSTWDELLREIVAVTDGDVAGVRVIDIYRPAFLELLGREQATLQGYLDAVNDHLVESATEAGIAVGRVHDAFVEGPVAPGETALVARDLVHPSDRGHEVIADELAELGTGLRSAD